MAYNLGKKFEDRVKKDWEEQFPNTFFIRLPDQQSRYKGQSSNVSDFLGFVNGKLFPIECKETKETTFNFKMNLGVGDTKRKTKSQYERLLEHKDDENTYPGVILWFSKFNVIVWLDITKIEQMVKDDLKSFNIKMIEDNSYNVIVVPTRKLRTFLQCDFSFFRDYSR